MLGVRDFLGCIHQSVDCSSREGRFYSCEAPRVEYSEHALCATMYCCGLGALRLFM